MFQESLKQICAKNHFSSEIWSILSICFVVFFPFSAATSTNSIEHVVAIQLTTITNIENEKMTDLPGSENKPQDKDKNDQDKNDNSHAPVQETSTKDQPKNASQSQDTMVKHTEPEDGEDESSRLLTTTEPPQSDTDTQTMNIALRENLMKRKGDHIV